MGVADDPTFLTIIAWPDGWTFQQQVDLTAQGTGLDQPTLRLRMKQQPPFIVGAVAPEAAAQTIRALRSAGGDGLAIPMSRLEALGATHKIRDVRLTPAGIELAIWRGRLETIDPASVDVLVTAGIASESSERREPGLRTSAASKMVAGTMIGGVGLGMAMGAADVIDDALTGGGGYERRTTRSYKLDIHTRDAQTQQPKVYQIDGDKFAFSILGDLKGHSDLANTRRMVEFFQHLAPHAIVDEYFALFKPPAGHHRMRLPHQTRTQDDITFAFYSRWAAIVYRYLAA